MLSLASNISSTQVVESKYSASFDGSGDYINLDSFASLLSDDMAFSLSIWFKGGSNSGSTGNILFSAHNSSYNNVITIGVDASGTKGIFFSDAGTGNQDGIGDVDLDNGAWHNLIVTRPAGAGGQQLKIYIDGGSAITTDLDDSDPSWTSATRISIGQEYDGAPPSGLGDFYEGLINDVAFWDVELNNTSRLKVYNSGKPFNLTFDQGDYDNSSNLIGYWKMGNGFFDDKANGIVHDQDNPGFGSNLVIWDGSTTGDWSVAYANTTLSANSGRLRATANASGAYGVSQSFTTVVGGVYRVDYNINVDNAEGGSGNLRVSNSSSLGPAIATLSTSTKVGTDYFTATATTTHVGLVDTADDSNNYLELESISVKKLNGKPGVTSGGVTFSSDTP